MSVALVHNILQTYFNMLLQGFYSESIIYHFLALRMGELESFDCGFFSSHDSTYEALELLEIYYCTYVVFHEYILRGELWLINYSYPNLEKLILYIFI